MQVVSNVALISINETLIVQLISFLIFLFIINRLMFRPLRSTMAERQFVMEEMQADIDKAGKNYEKAMARIQRQEAEARSEALQISKTHEEAGDQEAHRIFNSARDEIARERDRVEAEVAEKIATARAKIAVESESLALSILEKILDRRVSP